MNILEELKKLKKDDILYIVFELMLAEKLDYTELSRTYVAYLKDKDKKNWINTQALAMMLSHFVPFNKYKKNKFIEVKSAYHLLQSGVFKTAPIEKKYKEIIKDYSEDENGVPN
jgi:hypothetical protein